MYPGRKRRKPVQRAVKPVLADGIKSNPSKRHRDRLNCELDRLACLLPFTEDVTSSLDKLSILRLSVSYLRSKTFFRVALKNHSCNKIADGNGNQGNRKVSGLADGVLPEGELLLQALNGFVLVVTADGLIFYVSHTIQDYLGFHQTDVMHQSVFELIHTEDQQEFRRNLHWALNPPTMTEAEKTLAGDKVTSTAVIPYSPEQLPPENTSFLERNFVCRFRCLLDNSSGFLALNFQGRLKFLHGQNKKAEDGTPIPPQLALFAVATPIQSPSILEIRTKNMIFRTKHTLDFTPLACDAKGKIVLGYTEAELRARGTGYQFIHAADMLHCAENHVRMIKTGESGLTVFRLLTKENRWAWVQANARLVYKNGKPDYIIATQRPLVDEEGGEELRKRSLHLPFTFATGEALLYQAACSNPGLPDPCQAKGRRRKNASSKTEKEQRNVDPSSLLGAMMQQDESVYVCHPASEPKHSYSSSFFSEAGGSGCTAGDTWQSDTSELGQQGVNAGQLDPLLSTLDSLNLAGEENCLNSDLFSALENLGLGADDLELLLFDERMVRLDTNPEYIPSLNDILTNGEILSYVHDSIVTKNDQELPGIQQPYSTQDSSQTLATNLLVYSPKPLEKEAQYSSQHLQHHQQAFHSAHQVLQQQDLLLQAQQDDQPWSQHLEPSNGQPQMTQEEPLQQLKVHLHTQCQFKPKSHEQLLINGMHSHSPANSPLRANHRWPNYSCQSAADQVASYKLDHLAGYCAGQNLDSYQQPQSTCPPLAPSGIIPSSGSHMSGAPCMGLTMNGGSGEDGQYQGFLTTSSTYQTFPQKQQIQGTPLCQYQPLNPSSNHFADLSPEQLQPAVDPYGFLAALVSQDSSHKVGSSCNLNSGDLAFPGGCVHPSGNAVPSDRLHPGAEIHPNPPTTDYYPQ
ncbi:aryl hydrocarbon receptor 1b isoform X2 [Scyliorhinus canicula]|nr:aryl hydrocarbon receptor 1b isoform X1 [Scyliorhinus canicula]XP_038644035.1 aryl hydrocarbon receptor 1b isoform X2 [Scyliorhinus canicula]